MTRTFQQRLVTAGYESYRDYLASPHWADVKRRYRASKLPQACFCGERRVQLHHRTYKNLGRERLWELVPLCDLHHEEAHRMLRGEHGKQVNLWASARIVRKKHQREGRKR